MRVMDKGRSRQPQAQARRSTSALLQERVRPAQQGQEEDRGEQVIEEWQVETGGGCAGSCACGVASLLRRSGNEEERARSQTSKVVGKNH